MLELSPELERNLTTVCDFALKAGGIAALAAVNQISIACQSAKISKATPRKK